MLSLEISIIGQGLFGNFLRKEFEAQGVSVVEDAGLIILAVPISAYEEVAQQYEGKHLVNVCSVQELSNNICVQYSGKVTGIHPMFGPRSPKENRTSVVTHTCGESEEVLNLFRSISSEIVTHLDDGRVIDGTLHDQMMALTHGATVQMAGKLKPIVEAADWIPQNCLPASFKRMKDVIDQLGDMSLGTLESIKSNPYLES